MGIEGASRQQEGEGGWSAGELEGQVGSAGG